MKKLRYNRNYRVLSQEQPAPLQTSIFAEQQARAKQGIITAPSGADAVIKALGDANPVTNTLAGVMRDAFSATPLNKKAIINLASRKVTIIPADMALGATITGLEVAAAMVPTDPTKASSPMAVDPEFAGAVGGAVNAATAAAAPSFSVESMCNKIEDLVTAPDGAPALAGKSALIVVDQEAGTIIVYAGDVATVAAKDGAALDEDAQFVQTLAPAGGRQFGE